MRKEGKERSREENKKRRNKKVLWKKMWECEATKMTHRGCVLVLSVALLGMNSMPRVTSDVTWTNIQTSVTSRGKAF